MIEGFEVGWRESILGLVGLAAGYLVIQLLRLTRVGRRPPRVKPPLASTSPESEPALYAEVPELSEKFIAGTGAQRELDAAGTPSVETLPGIVPDPLPGATTEPTRSGFGELLADHLGRSEMEAEIRRLRSEIETLRAEMEELRVARHVSPQYAEAMAMSQRGLTAQDVADRLGISLAEAELVHALSRGDTDFDLGDDDGADRFGERDDYSQRNNG